MGETEEDEKRNDIQHTYFKILLKLYKKSPECREQVMDIINGVFALKSFPQTVLFDMLKQRKHKKMKEKDDLQIALAKKQFHYNPDFRPLLERLCLEKLKTDGNKEKAIMC